LVPVLLFGSDGRALMRVGTIMSGPVDVQDVPELFTHSEEHRGWTVVVGVKRVRELYYPEIFVRSPGTLSGTCIPHGGVYASVAAARDAGLRIGCRWIDLHGISD
jgi:hypothetical protein